MHPANGFWNFTSLDEFRREVRQLRAWFRPGRKRKRRKLGIIRNRLAPRRVEGRASPWNDNVQTLLTAPTIAASEGHVGLAPHRPRLASRGYCYPNRHKPCGAHGGDVANHAPRWRNRHHATVVQIASQSSLFAFSVSPLQRAFLPGWAENDALAAEVLDGLSVQLRMAANEWEGLLFDPFLSSSGCDVSDSDSDGRSCPINLEPSRQPRQTNSNLTRIPPRNLISPPIHRIPISIGL